MWKKPLPLSGLCTVGSRSEPGPISGFDGCPVHQHREGLQAHAVVANDVMSWLSVHVSQSSH